MALGIKADFCSQYMTKTLVQYLRQYVQAQNGKLQTSDEDRKD